MANKLSSLIEKIDELTDAEERDFDEIPYFIGEVEAIGEKAALLICGRHGKVWLPLKHLRTVGTDVYASKWILAQRGMG